MADCTTKHEHFHAVKISMPEWLTLGMRFLRPDGTQCVYIGEGGWRNTEHAKISIGGVDLTGHAGVYTVVFNPVCHVYAWYYKNEVFLGCLEDHLDELPELRQA